ncbi:MAG TPA: Hpt domain-containing protein [Chthoniobacteraceae bacterium]|nr:Hpt domain-containing protein [Chthoniobacteraceae bacterium]
MSTLQSENHGESQAQVFDPARLALLMEMEEEGDTSMVKDIAVQFVEDVTGVMRKIEAAIAAGSFAQVAGPAHTIKGGAATFGLFQVEKIARELESCAKDAMKHNCIPAIYESLRAAFAKGREALENYFNGK